jgi:IS5 family transposase
LVDRLSFRKFCGFPADAETPDETAFVRFHKTLVSGGAKVCQWSRAAGRYGVRRRPRRCRHPSSARRRTAPR